MTLKQYLTTMLVAAGICATAWIVVLTNVDPFTADALGFAFFYASLFLTLAGVLSVCIFFARRAIAKPGEPLFRHVDRSFKESLLLSSFVVLALFLQGKQWLNIWNGTLLLLFLVLLISFSLSIKRPRKSTNAPNFHIQ